MGNHCYSKPPQPVVPQPVVPPIVLQSVNSSDNFEQAVVSLVQKLKSEKAEGKAANITFEFTTEAQWMDVPWSTIKTTVEQTLNYHLSEYGVNYQWSKPDFRPDSRIIVVRITILIRL